MGPRKNCERESDSYRFPSARGAAVVVVVGLAVLGFVAAPVVADSAATVRASPNTPGATATHTATLVVDDDIDDFDYFRVDYSAEEGATDVGDVDRSDIVRFGVDTDNDSEIEKSLLTDDWEMSIGGSGHTLRVRNQDWNGTLSTGDVIIIEFQDVENPGETGSYYVDVVLNGHQEERTTYDVTDESGSSSTDTATPTATESSSSGGSGSGGGSGGSGGGDDGGGGWSTATDSPSPTDTPASAGVDGDDSDATDTATEAATGGSAGDSPTEEAQAAGADTAGEADAMDADDSNDSDGGFPWLLGGGLLAVLMGGVGTYLYKFR